MLSRIFSISILTGLGNLVSFIAITILSKHTSVETVGIIGTIDSFFFLLTAIISFGLQLATSRALVISDNWEKELFSAQESRFSLSLIIFFGGLITICVTNKLEYFIFLIAPTIALNLNYSLYGYGKPILGALLSFIFILLPSSTLLLGSFLLPDVLPFMYIVSYAIGGMIAGVISAKIIGVKYLYKFKKLFLMDYLNNFNLGIAGVGLSLSLTSFLSIMSFFYSSETIGYSFVAIKLYILFKGFRRILVQGFLKDILNESRAILVDYLSIIVGVLFFVITFFYSEWLILLFYSESYLQSKFVFQCIGISALISSLITTYDTRILLNKNDNLYVMGWVLSSLISITFAIVAFYFEEHIGIPIAFVLGELIRFFVFKTGIANYETTKRLIFAAKNLVIVFIPIISSIYNIVPNQIIQIIALILLMLLINKKIIKSFI